MLRRLYYLCKVFGLTSYSYVAHRRNKRVKPDYGYMNYIFSVLWLVLFTVGLPIHILTFRSFYFGSETSQIAWILYTISSYSSGIVGVVWVSVIKRRTFIAITEIISEVYNKLQYNWWMFEIRLLASGYIGGVLMDYLSFIFHMWFKFFRRKVCALS